MGSHSFKVNAIVTCFMELQLWMMQLDCSMGIISLLQIVHTHMYT
jgi:hypothetical protein